MTSLRSVIPRKSSNGRSKLTLLRAFSPIFCLVPNTVDTDQDTLNEAPTDVDMTPINSDMVEEQLKDTYESVMQQFNNSEFAPYLKAAVRAAAKKFVDMSTSPSSPTDPSDLVSILVECLKTELEKGGVYSREVAVLSDGNWLSSVREWAQGLGNINWGPVLSFCGLLGALPLASGVTAEDEQVPPLGESGVTGAVVPESNLSGILGGWTDDDRVAVLFGIILGVRLHALMMRMYHDRRFVVLNL